MQSTMFDCKQVLPKSYQRAPHKPTFYQPFRNWRLLSIQSVAENSVFNCKILLSNNYICMYIFILTLLLCCCSHEGFIICRCLRSHFHSWFRRWCVGGSTRWRNLQVWVNLIQHLTFKTKILINFYFGAHARRCLQPCEDEDSCSWMLT